MILYISVMSTVTFPFSFLMLLIWALACIFSENQLLVSLMFYIVFFISISLTSVLIFVNYFLLLALDFVSCSLVALDVRLGCLRFFLFPELFSQVLSPLFSFWDSYNANVGAFNVPEVLDCPHFILFSLFCFVAVISTILPSSSRICFSASSYCAIDSF